MRIIMENMQNSFRAKLKKDQHVVRYEAILEQIAVINKTTVKIES